MPYHLFRDGGFRNLNAQLEQLAVNAWRTPARVVAAHHPDQIPNLLRHAGPTWLAAGRFSTSTTSESPYDARRQQFQP